MRVVSVALLIEVDSPHPVLVFLKVRRDFDNIIVGSHIQQVHKTTFVELNKFFG